MEEHLYTGFIVGLLTGAGLVFWLRGREADAIRGEVTEMSLRLESARAEAAKWREIAEKSPRGSSPNRIRNMFTPREE